MSASGSATAGSREPIAAREIAGQLVRPEAGAICIFEGIVRNNSKGKATRYLEYEAYEQMALKKMEEIGEFVRSAWDIQAIGIVHRPLRPWQDPRHRRRSWLPA